MSRHQILYSNETLFYLKIKRNPFFDMSQNGSLQINHLLISLLRVHSAFALDQHNTHVRTKLRETNTKTVNPHKG
jgi:hypothetical protein